MCFIGDSLAEARKRLGLSQPVFAERLKLKATTISRYETGAVKPSTDFYNKIADIYNISVDWLITGKGEMFYAEKELEIKNNINLKNDLGWPAMIGQLVDSNSNLIKEVSKLTSLAESQHQTILKFLQKCKIFMGIL